MDIFLRILDKSCFLTWNVIVWWVYPAFEGVEHFSDFFSEPGSQETIDNHVDR